jgi:putative transposase
VPVVSVAAVKQVVKVQILPTADQAAALQATLNTCNEAASWLSTGMHTERVRRKHDAQKRFYTELKERFGLSAQPAIRVIAKVADAYTTLKANIAAGNYGPPCSQKRTGRSRPIGQTDLIYREEMVSLRHRRGARGAAGPASAIVGVRPTRRVSGLQGQTGRGGVRRSRPGLHVANM